MVRRTSQLSRRICALLEPDSNACTRCRFRFNVGVGLAILSLLLVVSAIRVNQVDATEPKGEQVGMVSKGLRAMTYVTTVVKNETAKVFHETVVEDGRYRSEVLGKNQPSVWIEVSDATGSESITLLPSMKGYFKPALGLHASRHTFQHLENLKNGRAQATALFDAKEIDGQKAVGFSIRQFQRNYTVWNDAVTGELVQIEFDDFGGDHGA
jgi:hypothetical protein